jgi:hypothetical protein
MKITIDVPEGFRITKIELEPVPEPIWQPNTFPFIPCQPHFVPMNDPTTTGGIAGIGNDRLSVSQADGASTYDGEEHL